MGGCRKSLDVEVWANRGQLESRQPENMNAKECCGELKTNLLVVIRAKVSPCGQENEWTREEVVRSEVKVPGGPC